MRGEQVAFDAVGEELERFARRALPLARQPRADPFRQLRALDRLDLDHHAGAASALNQRGLPCAALQAAAA